MPAPVYRVMHLLCTLVSTLPIGTNLGLAHLLWMLLSGALLVSRGAIIPGLSTIGLPVPAVRRAWATLGQGTWTSDDLIARLVVIVETDGRWQPHTHAGYQPVAVDTTGFWRPRLVDCPTKHYSSVAGKAVPAVPLGLVARVGSVQGQRVALPLTIVRADPTDPSPQAHQRRLVQRAKAVRAPDDVLVFDRGFGVALLQGEEVPAWVVRLPKNFTARLPGAWSSTNPWRPRAPALSPAQGAAHSRHAARPGRDLDGGSNDSPRRAMARPRLARRGIGQWALHRRRDP